jgi:hypothetical protein
MTNGNFFSRAGIFFIIFLLLHFLYDFVPHPVVGIVSGTSEAVFQHLKMGFYSYLAAGLIESRLIPAYRPVMAVRPLFSLLGTAVMVPWMLFLLYYLLPAFFGEVENMVFHVIYSVCITYIAGLMAAVLRDEIAHTRLSLNFRTLILILWTATLLIVLVFNNQAPPLDLFELP